MASFVLTLGKAAPGFDAGLIHELPPSVAEWHSREGMAFCAKAERAGLTWAEAHLAFTGERLRAVRAGPGRLIIFSGGTRSGFLDLLRREQEGLSLRVITSPEHGSHESSRLVTLNEVCRGASRQISLKNRWGWGSGEHPRTGK